MSGGAALPPTHSLMPGWNLVAVTTLDEVVKTADADAIDANTYLGNNWLRAITYNAATGRFVSLGPDDEEAPMLEVVMKYTRHNQTKAAQVLGLNRGTLRKKLKQYGLL